jgi:protocatechuate 3,4-dioxygenase beta subunit
LVAPLCWTSICSQVTWEVSDVRKTSRVMSHLEIIIALLGGVGGFGLQPIMAQTPPPGAQLPHAMTVGAPAGSISGHVYRADNGAPLASVVLTLHLTHWLPPVGGPPAPPPAVRTGLDGAYTFSSVEPEDYTIQVGQRGGFLVPQPPIRRATVAAGQATQDIDFRMQPAAAISGSVHDEYGDPLPRMTAAVFCQNPDVDPGTVAYSGHWEPSAKTDDEGNFRVPDIPPGRCYVAVASGELFSGGGPLKRAKFYPDADSMQKAQIFEVKPGEEISHLSFRFPLALSGSPGALEAAQQIQPLPSPGPTMASVSGHIYRADTGAPIVGAILHLYPYRVHDHIFGDAPVPSPLTARTGPDGSYTFATVAPGDYGIDVERQGFARLTLDGPSENEPKPGRISLETGQHVGNLDYKLKPTGAISGSVRDQDDVPLQGMFVTAFCSLPTVAVSGGANTDDRGDFRIFGIPPGKCDLGAGPPPNSGLSQAGYRAVYYPSAATIETAQAFPVKPGGEISDIHLVVPRSTTYALTVRVLEDANNSGANRYLVVISAAEPNSQEMVNTLGFGARFPVTAAPGVDVAVPGLSPGIYNIHLQPLQEVTGARGPTVRRPDGTIDPRGPRNSHGWRSSGPAVGSAVVPVVGRDVSVAIPISIFPPGGVPPNEPAIKSTHTFRRDLGAGDWVSGPQLTYHHGETTRKYEVEVSEEGFDAKRMADGRIMIKEGPKAIKPYGRQVESCPSMKLEIWALDSNLNLITLLNLGTFLCGGGSMASSGDFTVSLDWPQITEYLQTGPDDAHLTWSSATYCLKGGFYTPCGRKDDVKPPEPPVIRQKLGGDSPQ